MALMMADAPNGPELSRPDALGLPRHTLRHLQREFESPFSAAVRVGSSELLGGHLGPLKGLL